MNKFDLVVNLRRRIYALLSLFVTVGLAGFGVAPGVAGASQQSMASLSTKPIGSYAEPGAPLTFSGIFRPKGGADVEYDIATNASFFDPVKGSLATHVAAGYGLTNIELSNETGLVSAIFQQGATGGQIWVLSLTDFKTKVEALASQGQFLIDVTTYLQNGQRWFVGVFRPGTTRPEGRVDLSWAQFGDAMSTQAARGFSLARVKAYIDNGQTRFLGLWQPGGGGGYYLYGGDWNSFAKIIYERAAHGQHLVTMSAFVENGARRYVGVWQDGLEDYEIVAATDKFMFDAKAYDLKANRSLVPVLIQNEAGYMPPVGLAAEFHDELDQQQVGYSYAVTERGHFTATGAFGDARAWWEPVNGGLHMTDRSRIDLASVTKTFTVVALLKALQQAKEKGSSYSINTPFVDIICYAKDHIVSCPTRDELGAGVSSVTLGDLVATRSGVAEDNNCSIKAAILKDVGETGYKNINFCILAKVVEQLSGKDLQTYLRQTFFEDPSFGVTDTSCVRDNTSSTLPLYYTPGAAPPTLGWTGDVGARSLLVCGAGGLQSSAFQLGKFMLGLSQYKVLDKTTFDLYTSGAYTAGIFNGTMPTVSGTGWWRQGGYGASQGMASALDWFAGDTQIALLVTANDLRENSNQNVQPATIAQHGFNQMHSQPIGTWQIRNRANALCLDVAGASTTSEVKVVQWGCTGGDNQRFIKRPVTNNNYARTGATVLEVSYDGQCLGINRSSTNSGASLVQREGCDLPDSEQFMIEPAATAGYWTIAPKHTYQLANIARMCLTATGTSANTGSIIVQKPCKPGEPLQEFTFEGP